MNAYEIRGLIQELIDENPFAIRAVLKILAVEFTEAVPTLAVTCEERPRLLVNLRFVERHCVTPEHVKAVLCHEFLHVLLRHTTIQGPLTMARHLALDAVINAIVHRQLGPAYSDMMTRYYADAVGLMQLLRPMRPDESEAFRQSRWVTHDPAVPCWAAAWHGLYAGTVLADDVEQLARDIAAGADMRAGTGVGIGTGIGIGNRDRAGQPFALGDLLGNHDDDLELPESLEAALERARREMNGSGVWRGAGRGVVADSYAALIDPRHAALAEWKRRTLEILKAHLQPAPGAPRTPVPVQARLPVLSTADRRAFLRATWSPFLPEAAWEATAERPRGRAHVYLDVSGSMNAEMPLIVALLGHLAGWIRRPFWAFSDVVAPAVIERGRLKTSTTGGTSLRCVLEHVAKTRPAAAVIVTDGFIERIPVALVRRTRPARLHAILTRDGNPAPLRAAGIPYSQLGRVPT
jgi:hypothetical protein